MWRFFLALAASPAAADALDAVDGIWGLTRTPGFTCAANPTTIRTEGERLVFSTPRPAPDFDGTPILSYSGRVLSHDADTLVLLRDHETRRDGRGDPILWTLHLSPDGFCWERSDQPRPLCPAEWHRCEVPGA